MATILLVENNNAVRRVCEIALSANHKILEASDGITGFDLFETNYIDLIITDLLMPGIDGFELIRLIRAFGSSVKIIVYSAMLNQNSALEIAYRSGANACLAKPIDIDSFESTITNLLAEPVSLTKGKNLLTG